MFHWLCNAWTELGPQTARLRSLRVRPRPFSVLSQNRCVNGEQLTTYGRTIGENLAINQRIALGALPQWKQSSNGDWRWTSGDCPILGRPDIAARAWASGARLAWGCSRKWQSKYEHV